MCMWVCTCAFLLCECLCHCTLVPRSIFVHILYMYLCMTCDCTQCDRWQPPCEDLERSGEQGTDVFLSWKMAAESLQSEQ